MKLSEVPVTFKISLDDMTNDRLRHLCDQTRQLAAALGEFADTAGVIVQVGQRDAVPQRLEAFLQKI